jgi:hypothetical protein
VNSFIYLGSFVAEVGGADEDLRGQIRKVEGAFIQLFL